jgi:hypothetical protein
LSCKRLHIFDKLSAHLCVWARCGGKPEVPNPGDFHYSTVTGTACPSFPGPLRPNLSLRAQQISHLQVTAPAPPRRAGPAGPVADGLLQGPLATSTGTVTARARARPSPSESGSPPRDWHSLAAARALGFRVIAVTATS